MWTVTGIHGSIGVTLYDGPDEAEARAAYRDEIREIRRDRDGDSRHKVPVILYHDGEEIRRYDGEAAVPVPEGRWIDGCFVRFGQWGSGAPRLQGHREVR